MNENQNKIQNTVQSINMAKYEPVATTENISRNNIVEYGEDNNYPAYLIDLMGSAPVHGTLVKNIARIIAGKSVTGNGIDLNQFNANKLNVKLANDLKLFGGFYVEVIYTLDKTKIASLNHLPFENCRLSVDDNDAVNGVFYSRDWQNTRKAANKPVYLSPFNPDTAETSVRQVYWKFLEAPGMSFYPKPDYYSGLNYIELSRQIATFHVNNIMNGLFPSFILTKVGEIPDEQQQLNEKRKFEGQIGAGNAGKFWLMHVENENQKPQIDAFPITDADKQYDYLGKESTAQVLISHQVTSPLLYGIRDGGGLGSNTDEMKTALEIFTSHVVEPFQIILKECFTDILGFMGLTAVEIEPNSPISTKPAEPAKQVMQDKVSALDEFIAMGEDSVEDGILIDAFEADANEEEDNVLLTSTGIARPNKPSEQDENIKGRLFITRYRYRGELKADTREFCRKMLAANKLYRKEDIVAMENKAVNPGWGPHGADTYNIWFYKGGGNCYHFWQKEVYVSAKGLGIDVNSPNARKEAVAKAEKAGYKIRNEKLVAQLPIDMPWRGFLPPNN